MPKPKISNPDLKADLVRVLKQKGLFWSYAISENNLADFSDEVLIEQALLFGSEANLAQLFTIYRKSFIRKIWVKYVVPDSRYQGINFYLAVFWFHIPYNKIISFLELASKQNSRETVLKRSFA